MTLDVEVPDPPSLRGPQSRDSYEAIADSPDEVGDDYRREELEAVLADGAWADAFREWATGTTLAESEFETVVELDLVDDFDFYWDPASDEVGYRSPAVPSDAKGAFDPEDAAIVEEELDDLGRAVTEMLENDYLLRDEETWGFFAEEEPEDESAYESENSEE
ncbi:hypothetical protein [Halorarum halobium]|uniref:hypothetical protein n=1 Tax=Halorarum halobium TaxID=3075121 RepID=UPI0028A7DB63|nr:hypothetical protein [Halobaculum sp. XH14]